MSPALLRDSAAGHSELKRVQEERPEQEQHVAEGRSFPHWLIELPEDRTLLGRVAVIALALIIAFLAVVELWQVPRPTTLIGSDEAPADDDDAERRTGGSDAQPGVGFLSFESNTARTVSIGLGGLAVVAIGESFWQQADVEPEPYYLVWFVIFFFSFLVVSASFRGATEFWRSWIANESRAHALRASILVGLDTVFNVIQGRNELESVVWSRTILALQASQVRTVNAVREELEETIVKILREEADKCGELPPDRRSVRVNVSLLSRDEQRVFYLAWSPNSVYLSFGPDSVAWVVARTRRARWWRESYTYSYESAAQCWRSAQLRDLDLGTPARKDSQLTKVEAQADDGGPLEGQLREEQEFSIRGKRTDGSHVSCTKTVGNHTIDDVLTALREQFNKGGAGVHVDLTPDGRIVLKDTATGPSQLECDLPAPLEMRLVEEGRNAIVLLDNTGNKQIQQRAEQELLLRDYFQVRNRDYHAFVVIPAPRRRGAASMKRTACVHISLREEKFLGWLWDLPELQIKHKGEEVPVPLYELEWQIDSWPEGERAGESQSGSGDSLDNLSSRKGSTSHGPRPRSVALAVALRQAIPVIAEVVQELNDAVVENYVRSRGSA